MTQLKTNVHDIKTIAKNLASSLHKDMNFKITHSAALNLASRSLGFANYNTYKATDELKYDTSYSKEQKPFESRSFSTIAKEVQQQRQDQYPSIDNNFIKFGENSEFNIFLYEEDDIPFLLCQLKNDLTGRVFFNSKYETFSLFVYPNIKTAFNSYDISIQNIPDKHLNYKYFDITKHLIQSKKWINENLSIMDDLFSLMESVKTNRTWFKDLCNEHSEEKLSKLWQAKK